MSLPGADELFRTTGGMALSPSLAPRPAAEASRPETARTGNGTDGAEGAEGTQDAQSTGETGRRPSPQDQPAATVPAPAQPPVQRSAGVQGGRAAAATSAGAPAPARVGGASEEQAGAAGRARPRGRAPRRPSGRERHDEKITVYVSAEELMDLEHTRLVLRGEHGLAVDRGRIVREAIAVVLADLEQRGEASILVRRLRGR
ncbi:hypothetical protein PUR71_01745 [Streptomyces sp. SP17BM10]|uniref:hypothetical protein n=1 Tax=Streptomyces sp. SP17BM10 TaxID=3002530 RepID=UPI002E7778E8|nr:hypothetical protein [Streptomyces sp. SP17BM10]MEE1781664.1 hypothetical protein [Streptomyces sp. SP17BM10]